MMERVFFYPLHVLLLWLSQSQMIAAPQIAHIFTCAKSEMNQIHLCASTIFSQFISLGFGEWFGIQPRPFLVNLRLIFNSSTTLDLIKSPLKYIAIKMQVLISVYLSKEEYTNNIYKCAHNTLCCISLVKNTFFIRKKELEKNKTRVQYH